MGVEAFEFCFCLQAQAVGENRVGHCLHIVRVSKDAMVWPMVAAGVPNDDIRYARDIAPDWEVED